jgi:hypothetical protein
LHTPPHLCDFDRWIDTEINEEDKEYLRRMKQWDAERKEILEKRHQEEAAEKERKEEVERRHAAERREEREQKLERVRRAKAAMEENPDALRKGSGLVAPSSLAVIPLLSCDGFDVVSLCSHVLVYFLCCPVMDLILFQGVLMYSATHYVIIYCIFQ